MHMLLYIYMCTNSHNFNLSVQADLLCCVFSDAFVFLLIVSYLSAATFIILKESVRAGVS